MLAAADQGLGTCWMGSVYRDAEIRSLLGVPANLKVVAITPIGEPDEKPAEKQRKNLTDIVSWEKYDTKKP